MEPTSGDFTEESIKAALDCTSLWTPEAARAGAASEARTQSVRTRAAKLRIFFIMDPS